MGFLLSHWHCILPLAGIAAAMCLMREKPDKIEAKFENFEENKQEER